MKLKRYYLVIIIGILIGSAAGYLILTMTFQDMRLLLGAILGSSLSALYIIKRMPAEHQKKAISISIGVTVIIVILLRFWLYR